MDSYQGAFIELVGQDHVISILQTAVAASRTGEGSLAMTHAWFFSGPPGSGRSTAAVAFAQALICPNNACGVCSYCHSAKSQSHPDVEIFRTEGISIKVEEVRELISRVAWAPSQSGWRVVVIEDADRLTESAANALLKAIEEPGMRTVWLLCAPTVDDLIPTIRSRCRHLQLHTPTKNEIVKFLVERDHVTPAIADFSARVSQGHIGRARYLAIDETNRVNRRSIMQLPLRIATLASAFQAAQTLIVLASHEYSTCSSKLDEDEVYELQKAYGKSVASQGLVSGGAAAVKNLEKIQRARSVRMVRDSIDNALLDLATFYRDVMMFQLNNRDSIINIDMCEEIQSFANTSQSHSNLQKINAIFEARKKLKHNTQPLIICEALMCALGRP